MDLIENVGRFRILIVCVLASTFAPVAQSAVLRCDALSASIDRKLQKKHVRNYKLEVLPINKKSRGKYEGRCDGGSHKVVFFRNVATATASAHPAPAPPPPPPGSPKPEWQIHLDWCWNNFTTDPGMTNCVEQYVAAGAQKCIVGGGRKCLIGQAAYLATHGHCADAAFPTTLVCQCNNGGARQKIAEAGPDAVCSYVKSIVPGGDLLKYLP
jgi:hypothetical protein